MAGGYAASAKPRMFSGRKRPRGKSEPASLDSSGEETEPLKSIDKAILKL